MNRLLSHDLWPTIAKLAKNAVKRAAIAYVSSDEFIQFGDGDILICDASANAIRAGQTSAAVLKRAFDRNAQIYNLLGLHAKIILLNDVALIGSANASDASANNLVEAGLLTDQPTIVASAQSFVNHLTSMAVELDDHHLKKLLAIKVVKRLRRTRFAKRSVRIKLESHRTWIVGTTELLKHHQEDQAVVEEAVEKCNVRLSNPRSSVEPLRWIGRSTFREKCQRDGWLIQMWRPRGRKLPSMVFERMPVLERLELGSATYFLCENFPKSDSRAKSWNEFKKLAERAGIKRQIKPGSEFEITANQADSLQALWKEK